MPTPTGLLPPAVTGTWIVVRGVNLYAGASVKHDLKKGSDVELLSRDDDLFALDLYSHVVGKLLEFIWSDRSDVQTPQEVKHFRAVSPRRATEDEGSIVLVFRDLFGECVDDFLSL